ncbi:MAG: EAL domain-containing protein [Oceanospirillaceae bacterium]
MTLQTQAKSLLKYQSLGIIGIVLFIIVGVFSYFLFKDNSNNKYRLEALNKEIYIEQKQRIRAELKNARDYIFYKNSQAEVHLKQQTKIAVEHAISIANGIYQQQKSIANETQIEQMIVAALRDLRFFNGRGYFFIDQLDSKIVMQPPSPHLEGTYSFSNPDTVQAMNLIFNSVKNLQRAGHSSYLWYSPADKSQMIEKITYAQVFEPLGWVIGTGDYIASFEDDLRTSALKRLSSIKSESQVKITILDNEANILSQSQTDSAAKTTVPELSLALRESIIEFANNSDGGFVNFSQLNQSDQYTNNRFAYIETIIPFSWIVVADIAPSKMNNIINQQKKQLSMLFSEDLTMLIIVLIITSLSTLLILYIYNFWFKRLFKNYQINLDLQQQEINASAKALQLASRVFESSNDAIVVSDAQHSIVAVNPACVRLTGYNTTEVLGKRPTVFGSDHQDKAFYKQALQQLEKVGYWQGELSHKHKNGQLYPVWLTISTSLDNQHNILNYISIFSDISERKKTEKHLSYLADFDLLTKLSKRHVLAKRAQELITADHPANPQKFALMIIDLDRFKNINDSLGHNIGDQVLKMVAKRLSANTRASDSISRLNGDEFIILVNHSKAGAAATRLASRVLRDLAVPLEIAEHSLVVTPSIGIAIFPENGDSFDTLLKNSDAALNHAKNQGRNHFQFFTHDMHLRASELLTIEHRLRRAIDKNQLELHYQAQFDLSNGDIIGCEALLRWNCPELNSPGPDTFIPVAEETGLILPIGQWVLDQACAQAVIWQNSGLQLVPIAVNVSSYQFNKNIVKSIQHSLNKVDLDSKWLVVEITESALMQDPEFTKDSLLELRALGVKIALDDFGTGYSSLAYLKRFPIDKLKIDRAFITGLPQDQDDLVITRSIIDVARNLNMTTIAEGVETLDQQLLLRSLGCDQMQGFYKAKPINAAEFATTYLS